ncbi:ABC transporter substrate-binding protein [Streptomyces sp. NBC_01016]|uniref:peptide ABC transporter substrate-binding protein n=1 Tax=Streptomyces sp. NBC_01016 TaxID=2903720 RepID=UPI002254A65B|nr:ABC transporter substrate-binding protein [Streptomyces sp. NBC_01016]MCX4835200.1 ABC transporter substrate-binding protein [Streptomyces sp. NBC_01016]
MRRTRSVGGAVAAAALTLSLAACSGGSGGSDSSGGGAGGKHLTIGTAAEVPHLIPQNDLGATGIQIESALWAPLTQVDPKDGHLRNVVADSIKSKDARTWTIKIKPGWTFTNGEKLTAKSFVDTWNYTAYGPNGFANNGFFQRVEGYEALNPAKGKPKRDTLSGLKVIDDLTFQVKLKQPFSPYPTTLSYLGATALASEALKDPEKYTHKPIGYGAYKLDGAWKPGQPVNLVRNKGYKGGDAPEAESITFRFFANPETGYNEFLAGNLDFAPLPTSKMDTYKQEAAGRYLQAKAANQTGYLVLHVNVKPYDNLKVRRALSLALDRAALAKVKPGSVPSKSFTPSSIAGHRDDTCGDCKLDVAKAKKLLSEAGGFPGALKIYYSTDDSGSQVYAEAIGNMWRQKLGIKVKYDGQPGSEIGKLDEAGKLDGVRMQGWGHDYPSIEDYLTPVFASYGDVNTGKYDNPEVDKALQKANGIADQQRAIKAYQKVEDMAAADMPIIPLSVVSPIYLHAKGVEPLNSPYAGVDPIRSTLTR